MAPPRDRPGEGIGGGGYGGGCAVRSAEGSPDGAAPRGPSHCRRGTAPSRWLRTRPGIRGGSGLRMAGGGRALSAQTAQCARRCGAHAGREFRVRCAGRAAYPERGRCCSARGVQCACNACATRVQPLRVRTVPQPDRQPPLSHGPPPQKGGGCGGGGGAEQNEAGPPPPPSPPPGPPPAGADVPVPFSPPGSSAAAAGPNGTKRAGPGRAMTPPCGGALRCAVLCAVLCAVRCAQGSAATRAGTERPHGVGEGLG